MSGTSEVTRHYAQGDLLARLRAALSSDGADPDRPTIETLAPYDQFHGRGLEATMELAEVLSVSAQVSAEDHLLDVGSGIGGPARYMAERFGCRVTGIDLTAEFCAVARHLTRRLALEERLDFVQGNALAMGFADASFDAAYSMNVAMNIADKAGFYREIRRVLRPGALLVLSEAAQGPNGEVDYPTPWARTAASSFLATPAETRAALEACGFQVVAQRDTSGDSLAFAARSRALVERGEKPPHRAVQLIHGDLATVVSANVSRGLTEARLIPIEVVCRKPPSE